MKKIFSMKKLAFVIAIASWLMIVSPARAAISIVASTTFSQTTAGGSYQSSSVMNTTGANLYVIFLTTYTQSTASSSLRDSVGNTWTFVKDYPAPSAEHEGLFYSLNPITNSNYTFAFNSEYGGASFYAFSGMGGLDVQTGTGQTATPINVTTTPTQAGDLCLTGFGSTPGINGTSTSPFQVPYYEGILGVSNNHYSNYSGYYVDPTTAAVNSKWTFPTAASSSLIGACFKATPIVLPTVTTPTSASVTTSTATLGGNITSNGGASLTAEGITWGTSSSPRGNVTPGSATSTGVFTVPVTGLPAGTLIYFDAYATNSTGTAYSSDGTFTTTALPTSTVNLMVVAGGGGGGGSLSMDQACGGGGGAGGYLASSTYTVTSQAYTVTVGTGGAGGAAGGNPGSQGLSSIFGTITATGGGGGDSDDNSGSSGGSGGGGGYTSGDSGIAGQGYAGGSGSFASPDYGCGGGGGSSAVGGSGTGTSYGLGGAGTSNSITGSAVTYAMGGAGGIVTSGGNGGNGSPSTGNGGTGAKTPNSGSVKYAGGTGGSGVVIISYPTGTMTTTGGTTTISGGNTVVTFTSSGTFTVTLSGGAPTVTTPTSAFVATSTATLGGNITSNGGGTITAEGVTWGLTSMTNTAHANVVPSASTSTGVFTVSTTGLPINTFIYFNAYATNSAGTTYSSDGTFTTNATAGKVGTLYSQTFDTGVANGAQLNSVTWKGNVPSGTSIAFQVAVSNSSSGPWNYIGPDGTSGSTYSGVSGVPVSLGNYASLIGRYFRYYFILTTNTAQTLSPSVNSIIVNWSL